MPAENAHGHIYVDLALVVARNCGHDLDATAGDALFKFISEAVVAEVEQTGSYFGDRLYYRKRFGNIARHLEADVPHTRSATRDDIIAACEKEVAIVSRKIAELRDAAAIGHELGLEPAAPFTRICLQFNRSKISPTPREALEP